MTKSDTLIPVTELYQAALHILDSFLDSVQKPYTNFRQSQAHHLTQIQVLQLLAIRNKHVSIKIGNVYRRIDDHLPPSYSVLHESNIPLVESRRCPASSTGGL